MGLAVMMDRRWDRFFGKTKAMAIAKEKVIVLIYSLDLRAVVVAIEPDLPKALIARSGS